MMLKNQKIFGTVLDYFYVTKFQNWGNEHVHFMLWIKHAPIYGHCLNIVIENFIDKYISSDTALLDANLSKMQTHHHNRTCKKYKMSSCWFNFPLPPMERTTILEPLATTSSTLKEKEKNIFKQLGKNQ